MQGIDNPREHGQIGGSGGKDGTGSRIPLMTLKAIYCERNIGFLKECYVETINNREKLFLEIKGDLENGTDLFDAYAFVKNINPVSTLQYGDIEIVPFNKYKHLSEANMIDAFFKFDYSSTVSDGYGAVLYMKNILSGPEGEAAFEMINSRAGTIANLFSLENHLEIGLNDIVQLLYETIVATIAKAGLEIKNISDEIILSRRTLQQ